MIAPSQKFSLFGFEGQIYQLNESFQIVCLNDPRAPVLALSTWYRGGSRFDPPRLAGAGHMLEHLIFRSVSRNTGLDMDRELEALGADSNAATWADWANYYFLMPAESKTLDLAWRAELDRKFAFSITPEELSLEKEIVLREREQSVDNDPASKAMEILYTRVFGKLGYGAPTLGTPESIQNLSLKELQRVHSSHYSQGPTTLALTGDLNALGSKLESFIHTAAERCEDMLYNPPRHDTQPSKTEAETELVPPPISAPTTPQMIELDFGLNEPFMIIGVEAPDQHSPQSLPAEALMNTLAGGETSLLSELLVDQQNLAYNVEASYAAFEEGGLLEIWVDLKSVTDAAQVQNLISETIHSLTHLPNWAYEKSKHTMMLGQLKEAGDAEELASTLGHDLLFFSDPNRLTKRYQTIQALSNAEILAARDSLQWETLTSVCVR